MIGTVLGIIVASLIYAVVLFGVFGLGSVAGYQVRELEIKDVAIEPGDFWSRLLSLAKAWVKVVLHS